MVNEYFLAPNFTTAPPPEGPIKLGSILRNITEFDPLNRQVKTITGTSQSPVHIQDSVEIRLLELHAANVSFRARALGLLGLGAGASIERAKDSNNVISCKHLETHTFNPTDSYIEESMKNKDVKAFMRSSRFRVPVYMVTGLKVARGSSATTSTHRHMSVEQDVSVLPPEASVAVGTSARYSTDSSQGVKWDNSMDFIVAFKVKKIWLGRKDEVKHEAYRKRAVMQDGTSYDDDVPLTLESNDSLTSEEVEQMFKSGG
ncbi:hypothetical protein HG530_008162 [Fusarium avenaceum]|nr:hypothetical protein HG530_008162 [Fusarium avenaceum]